MTQGNDFRGHQCQIDMRDYTRREPNVGLKLGQRRRRCPNFKLTFVRRIVFTGIADYTEARHDDIYNLFTDQIIMIFGTPKIVHIIDNLKNYLTDPGAEIFLD